jgi:iron(III) transport system substrate-binding protein
MPRRWPLSPSHRSLRLGWLVALSVATSGAISGAAPAMAADPVTLTLYSAQHHQMVNLLTEMFTKQTGIAVRVHSGEAPEIANQIAQEGAQSPADVYFTENSPELTLLDEKGLLAHIDPATLAQVPATYSAASGDWLGVLARENVLAFNPSMIAQSQLPVSLLDLAKPEWQGKVAIAPSDADFLPLVDAVVVLKGRAAALDWLKGLKRNAQVFDDDEGVVAAVDRGAVATGIINNYYWARLRTEKGPANMHSEIHHFDNGDVGALVNVSGAAVLKSSQHQAEAQRFLAFLVSEPVQEMLGKSDIDFEYPLAKGVAPNPLLKPMSELQPPQITMAQLGDDQMAAELLREAGLL